MKIKPRKKHPIRKTIQANEKHLLRRRRVLGYAWGMSPRSELVVKWADRQKDRVRWSGYRDHKKTVREYSEDEKWALDREEVETTA